MALHLIPDDIPGNTAGHLPSSECPCRPDLVEVPVEHDGASWMRQAWQHRAVDAKGVEVGD